MSHPNRWHPMARRIPHTNSWYKVFCMIGGRLKAISWWWSGFAICPWFHTEKFGCTVDQISQVHFLVARNLTVLGYLSCFQQGVWNMLFASMFNFDSSNLCSSNLISDITLQGTGCFRRPRWFGGNESNRRKFTVPSKWVKKNKKDAMIQWDDDTMLSMCQWVFFTILIEMHRDFLPLVHSNVIYISLSGTLSGC